MKKIKFLILALLGITIIPTATNAYDIVNKFNGNYGLLYTEFKGSVLYRCPYSSNIDLSNTPQRKATSSSFPCVPGTNFSSTASSDQFYNYPTVSRSADVYQYITALKKKDGKYLPFGVNIQRKFGKFVVEHKNGTVEYDDALIWGWSNYGVSLKSSDGKYGDLLGGLFLDGLLIRSHTRDGEYTRPAYTSVIVIDTKTGYGYRFKTNVSLKENLDTSFFATFYALSKGNYDACGLIPTTRWRDNLIEHSFPSGNNCPELDINKRLEESLTVSKEMWKIFKEESPYYDPSYKINKMFGGLAETTAPSVNSAEAYNQCLAYYNSVKTYASYDRNCYKDLLDNNQDIAIRQQITDWDGEGEGPATDNRICNLWKGYKKSYKTKFKDKWSEFLELSSANRLSPHSLNVKDYCGERPELKDDRSFWEKTKDFFLGRTGDPRMVDDTGKKYYGNDFDSDWRALRSLYWKCQGLDQFGIMKSLSLSEEDKFKACSDYQTEKAKIIKKWEHATIGDFFGGSLAAAINRIEGGGAGSGFIEKLKNDISDSVIGDSFSYVGENIFGRIKAPFYSGYNSVLGLSCASSSIPHIEIVDYIAMGLFALLAFLIFKIL